MAVRGGKKFSKAEVKPRPGKKTEDETMLLLLEHYNDWNDDNDIRRTRKNGWDAVTDAYWGQLPPEEDWPYETRVVDPRIRTSIIDKTARLLNGKLRGRLIPRDGESDVLSAAFNNVVLDYQWDTASNGGTMLTKLTICDQDTRLYASKYALVLWKTIKDEDGNIIFDSNEFDPIDIRDFGSDFASRHIKDAKWAQVREWTFVEDLEQMNEMASGDAKFKNMEELKRLVGLEGKGKGKKTFRSDKRKNEYLSRIKQLKGLEDRLGEDTAFPIVEIVTEYRADKWFRFSPRHNLLLQEFDNPYDHKRIPVSQLRYYPLQDDPLGESEVEPVMGLWKAIQAVLCGYLDEMNIKMRPPLKIIEGAARIETIVYGAEAQWLVNRPDAITESETNQGAIRWFQTTYSALVSAFNTAMGDLSLGVSNIEPFQTDKTATEVRATERQQNVRDQKNQADLSEFIQDVMMMWLSNNRQFLFTNENKKQYVLRIVGGEMFDYFKRSGLDGSEVSEESMQTVSDIIREQGGNVSDQDITEMIEAAKVPKFPVIDNPEEKNPDKIDMKPKMDVSEAGDSAQVTLIPEDIQGTFDYIPDVRSMAAGAKADLQFARQAAIARFTNPNVVQLLTSEGWRGKIKELMSAELEEAGLSDADRFFEKLPGQVAGGQNGQTQTQEIPGTTPTGGVGASPTGQAQGQAEILQGIGAASQQPQLPTTP